MIPARDPGSTAAAIPSLGAGKGQYYTQAWNRGWSTTTRGYLSVPYDLDGLI